jgi:gliding motility-associated transport system ATP-binding protein
MIEVHRLTKSYGSIRAVRGIDFSVGRGEIVGLLGPNGAGKTTTMRMLTTFLTPSSGRASLAGHDVLDDPIGVRRSVGYLPESVPSYPEMRVKEFLRHRAALKDIPRRTVRSVLDRVIQRCGLEQVSQRVVGNLSKGFRQRVGLADAILHDPPILILDEPTSGLDPLQIREVRSLIRELGDHHTIVISTHLMPEVEAVCSRVLIVAAGRIALDEPLESAKATRGVTVEVRGPLEPIRGLLESAPGVHRVAVDSSDDGVHTFIVEPRSESGDLRDLIARRIIQNGHELRRLDLARSSLEDRFVKAVTAAVEESEVAA